MGKELTLWEVTAVSFKTGSRFTRFITDEKVVKEIEKDLSTHDNIVQRNFEICSSYEEWAEEFKAFETDEIRKHALSKLTDIEKQVLGLA